jgi:hypothetical protein
MDTKPQRVSVIGLTDEQIRKLRDEAGAAGDEPMVEICDAALHGDLSARQDCVTVINDAHAMRED